MPTSVQAPATGAFDNSYARLSGDFFVRQAPDPVAAPRLIRMNRPLAASVALDPDSRSDEDWAEIFAGNAPLPGSDPLAMAYAGHQFGAFVPTLGDGRALLLGELVDADGVRRDVQLKGAGRTAFGRRGDGRAALGPVLREYLVSEAMHAMGVPTTRALAAVTTGEAVHRGEALPGGVLTRVARSHVRVGTFQYFAARGETDAVRQLADYAIWRHDPDLHDSEEPYLGLLRRVGERQARLIAEWLGVGFIHGVMNTDNVSVAGETLDYGPCAFMDTYDPATVFSSIDHGGRYAYGNQLRIGQWNLARFAETLLPLIDADEERAIARATEGVEAFKEWAEARWLEVMRRKLGLADAADGDWTLVERLLTLMKDAGADFTLTFRHLRKAVRPGETPPDLAEQVGSSAEVEDWLEAWRNRLAAEGGSPEDAEARLRHTNPAVIPRNHQVEQALTAAVHGDFGLFHHLMDRLARPFDVEAEASPEATPPRPEQRVERTFCGT